jgi:peptidoglycan/LPS O-acetylase OafA/YrhL
MAQNEGTKKLRSALVFSIIVDLFYGIAFLAAPAMLQTMAGGNPVEFGWIRWSGGMLIATAIGAIQAYRDPHKQGSTVTILTIAPLLISLALLYTLLFDNYSVHTWFILVPCVVVFALFIVMALARHAAKDIL